jgi:hypothetical protein
MTRDIYDSRNQKWRCYAARGVGNTFRDADELGADAAVTLVECVRGEERVIISAPANWADEAAVPEASLRQLLEAKCAGHAVLTDPDGHVWRAFAEGRTQGIGDSANIGAEDLVFESESGEQRVVERVGLAYGVTAIGKLGQADLAELFARAHPRAKN